MSIYLSIYTDDGNILTWQMEEGELTEIPKFGDLRSMFSSPHNWDMWDDVWPVTCCFRKECEQQSCIWILPHFFFVMLSIFSFLHNSSHSSSFSSSSSSSSRCKGQSCPLLLSLQVVPFLHDAPSLAFFLLFFVFGAVSFERKGVVWFSAVIPQFQIWDWQFRVTSVCCIMSQGHKNRQTWLVSYMILSDRQSGLVFFVDFRLYIQKMMMKVVPQNWKSGHY